MALAKILWVDQKGQNLQLEKLFLENEGYDVRISTIIIDAVDFVKMNSVDIALIDAAKPDIGIDVYKQIRQANRNTSCVMIADKYAEQMSNLLSGQVDYITSPFNPVQLAESLKKILDSRSTPVSTDRYPGLWPFKSNQADVFFGRDREKEELFHRIRSCQVIVLFSKSGLGKSSLLNAGVGPLLAESGYMPVNIRFSQTSEKNKEQAPTPIDILKASLKEYSQKNELLFHKDNPRLWEFFKTCQFPNGATPVLIFDQFEEFFQYPVEQLNDILLQLSELIHERPPSRIIEWLLAIDTKDRETSQLAWAVQPPVKFVFAIRSDRLSELQKVDEVIPSVFSNRFELQALNEVNARSAIVQPAEKEDPDRFKSLPFTYEENVLEKILHRLKDKRTGEIECSQLQIVCQYIEDKVKKEKENKQIIKVIDETVFNADNEIETVQRNFYKNQLLMVGTPDEQELCRKVLEEHLLENGYRASLLESQIYRLLDNNNELLQKLLNARLIKVENTHLGITYEISHDSLVEPILKSKQEREGQDKKLKDKLEELHEAEKNIRNYYSELQNNQIEPASQAIQKAIETYDKYPDQIKRGIEARVLAVKIFELENKLSDALPWLEKTLSMASEGSDQSLTGQVYESFAAVYESLGELHLSYKYYINALNNYNAIPAYPQMARLAEHLGGIKEELYDQRSENIDADKEELESIIIESNNFYKASEQAYNVLGDRIGYLRISRSLVRTDKYIRPWGHLTELFTGQLHLLKGKRPIRIGRDVYNEESGKFDLKNEIGFSTQYRLMSRRHMTITPDLVIEDNQSMNGTTINTIPLYYGNPRKLTNGDILVLANIMPLLFTEQKPIKPIAFKNQKAQLPDDRWALLIDGASKNYHYFSGYGEAYSVIIQINKEDYVNRPYKIKIEKGESDNAIIKFKLIEGAPHIFVHEKQMSFKDNLGTWKLRTTIKDVDRFYKDYILNTNDWYLAFDFPLQPQLVARNKENEEIILAYGPAFQLIIQIDINQKLWETTLVQ